LEEEIESFDETALWSDRSGENQTLPETAQQSG
jgi:hypothetical protein